MLSSTSRGSIVPRVFKEEQGAEIHKGESARLSSFIGAIAIADLVKTTLGPKGMDKMLTSIHPSPSGKGDVTVTNDGATILKKIPVDNPAAKILVNISKSQDDEIGDGTTSVVVLAGELLREAERLTNKKMHPQTIIRGWRFAAQTALDALSKAAKDNRNNQKQFKQDLFNIAKTTLSSKIVLSDLDFFANLAVDAVLRLKTTADLDMIQIVKKPGGRMTDSFLDDGFILEKEFGLGQKKTYENPRIMVANTSMDTDKIKIWGAKVKVHSMAEVAEIEQAEKDKMKLKVEKICAHNIDVFINRQLIYDYPQELFTEKGVGSIEHADFDGVERLARVLDAEIMSTFDHPEACQLGGCKKIEEILIGEDTVLKFSGVPKGEACSIVLRGASSHLLDEMERSLHDALCVLTQTIKESRVVLGGGASEMLMAHAIDIAANKISGKEREAVDSFANALRTIPMILADNAGYDSAEIVAQLRAQHVKGNTNAGVNMRDGTVGDMAKLGIYEAYRSKSQYLNSAHEAAEMILRVDDIVKCAPRARDPGHH